MMAGSMLRRTDRITAGEGNAVHQLRAAMEETADQAKSSCSIALEAAQRYNAKLFEFAKTNSDAALNYVQELADARSPAEFIQITTRHAVAQIEASVEQAKELGALGSEDCLRICRAIQEVMVDLQNGPSQSRRGLEPQAKVKIFDQI